MMAEENGICCSGVEGALVNTQVVVFYPKHNTAFWDQSFAKHNIKHQNAKILKIQLDKNGTLVTQLNFENTV